MTFVADTRSAGAIRQARWRARQKVRAEIARKERAWDVVSMVPGLLRPRPLTAVERAEKLDAKIAATLALLTRLWPTLPPHQRYIQPVIRAQRRSSVGIELTGKFTILWCNKLGWTRLDHIARSANAPSVTEWIKDTVSTASNARVRVLKNVLSGAKVLKGAPAPDIAAAAGAVSRMLARQLSLTQQFAA